VKVPRRHLVLVGLPGAGKSSAGRLAAGLLGAPFTDLDEAIVLETGQTIPELFATRGEAGFRQIERDRMTRALAAPPQVIAPGGGWAAQPGNIERAGRSAFMVYLSVSPEVAAARLESTRDRPLLKGDPLTRLDRLLRERERWYRMAGYEIPTDAMSPQRVAEGLVVLARQHGGWTETAG
jgi:shikimate kinase